MGRRSKAAAAAALRSPEHWEQYALAADTPSAGRHARPQCRQVGMLRASVKFFLLIRTSPPPARLRTKGESVGRQCQWLCRIATIASLSSLSLIRGKAPGIIRGASPLSRRTTQFFPPEAKSAICTRSSPRRTVKATATPDHRRKRPSAASRREVASIRSAGRSRTDRSCPPTKAHPLRARLRECAAG